MKHPVRDRILILLCALVALAGAAASVGLVAGRLALDPAIVMMQRAAGMSFKVKAAFIVAALVLVILALLLIGITLPSKKKRSSNFAIQRNENGTVRISLKALETLVQKCLNQHAELKVVTSSLFSDEESIQVDVHITLQSDISMPLAISALQKQIKKYLEACSGVMVKEVRVFVDGTIPATEETAQSPYAIPMSLLGMETEALPSAADEATPVDVVAAAQEEEVPVFEEPAFEEEDSFAQEDEPEDEEQAVEDEEQKEQGEEA